METSRGYNELSLGEIALRCAQETQHYLRRAAHDAAYCFELFRRALVEHDQRAWDLVYQQYHAQLQRWVLRHSAFSKTDVEPQEVVNEVFARLWRAVTAENFSRFPALNALLQYMKMCVHSILMDLVRKGDLPEQFEGEAEPAQPGPAAAADLTDFWAKLRARLNGAQEELVVRCSFVYDMKPAEILAEHPGVFENVDEVYRIKQNVRDRLRRDPELRRFLGDA